MGLPTSPESIYNFIEEVVIEVVDDTDISFNRGFKSLDFLLL